MTDKQTQTGSQASQELSRSLCQEQIIIDGVDILDCDNYYVEQETDQVKCDLSDEYCRENKNCFYKQLARKTQIVEQQQKTLDELIGCVSIWEEFTEEESKLAKDSSIADLIMLLREKRRECEKLKKANQHIDANRQCKGSKLKRIEELISACEAGYTDEFIQKIYGIIQESEPTINDYSIIDRYRKALEEIEEYCNNVLSFTAVRTTESDILNIINKAKGGEDAQTN